MRGYFAIGVEGISKPFNIGNLFRSAHAFGASFVFTVDAQYKRSEGNRSDTSDTLGNLPFYSFPNLESMILPENCTLVGIELIDNTIDLPTFRHPPHAAYILGPERGSLSSKLLECCNYVIKIPTKFCINVSIAGAIVMYDRLNTLGQFQARPVRPGGPKVAPKKHIYGTPKFRNKIKQFRMATPLPEEELTNKSIKK